MAPQPGRRAVVRVPVATLWTAPEAVRPIDCPALAGSPDVAAWIAGMDRDQLVGDCVLTQLLLGEPVRVTETRPDGWVRVVALGQPAAKLGADGYPGWLRAAHLADPADADPSSSHPADVDPPGPALSGTALSGTASAGPAPVGTGPSGPGRASPGKTGSGPAADRPLTVDVAHTALRAGPDGDAALTGVVLGTRLTPAGPAVDGRLPVRVPGRPDPLWATADDLVPLPAERPEAEKVLAVAERLRDLVYVWGGMSTDGIDCSGLVHLAWRRYGITLPRDADDQAAATSRVPLDAERPGDLYFFARPGRRIHHVGIVSAEPRGGRRRMLHACYLTRRVVEEELPADRTATLVGAHRV
ncbi:C40 family peptidase [Micromonospora tulbaghiae]|uniref:NlpC/P60 family protein n=1 Tax=Micromonospora tulbaghiae TaxID=479978 RepID=A0ABY0KMV9_9ACTN|nr:C40 family peptidase [Micromonospora tulbaghiae]MDX5457892.1 NlpC/P60 family protein [Micromonospora tulbaghiae]SCE87552.1 NlpC/P60 family protein [Micromonospora tulbaghiae]